jgi:hypothetical protein
MPHGKRKNARVKTTTATPMVASSQNMVLSTFASNVGPKGVFGIY